MSDKGEGEEIPVFEEQGTPPPPPPERDPVPAVPMEQLKTTAPVEAIKHAESAELHIKQLKQLIREDEIKKNTLIDQVNVIEGDIYKKKQELHRLHGHHHGMMHNLCLNHWNVMREREREFRGYRGPNPSQERSYNPQNVHKTRPSTSGFGGRQLGFVSSSYGAYFG